MAQYSVNVGDVFALPIEAGNFGAGQVVAAYGRDAYYFAIFDSTASSPGAIDLDRVVESAVLFLALSLDAKFAAGHWTVIGRRLVSGKMPLPAYKEAVTSSDHFDVVDYSGSRRRRANRKEVEALNYRKVVAPVRLENALKAKHGFVPWLDVYSDLVPKEELTSTLLFPSAI